jgi:hypothetical protein
MVGTGAQLICYEIGSIALSKLHHNFHNFIYILWTYAQLYTFGFTVSLWNEIPGCGFSLFCMPDVKKVGGKYFFDYVPAVMQTWWPFIFFNVFWL